MTDDPVDAAAVWRYAERDHRAYLDERARMQEFSVPVEPQVARRLMAQSRDDAFRRRAFQLAVISVCILAGEHAPKVAWLVVSVIVVAAFSNHP